MPHKRCPETTESNKNKPNAIKKALTAHQKKCRTLFLCICFLYVIAIIIYGTLTHTHMPQFIFPVGVGLVLGTIYFAVAGYTFYDLFLSLNYQNNRAGMETVSLSKMISWLMPVSVMVFFVCASFMIIYDLPVDDDMNRGVYISHPYLLGSIYKDTHLAKNEPLNSAAVTTVIEKAHGIHFYASESVATSNTPTGQLSIQERAEAIANIHKIPFLISFTFSFIGVLIFTLTDVVSRFRTKDLYPKTFIGYQIRFLFAISLAVVISNFYMDYWPTCLAPILFMGIGMFPERAMTFVEKKMMNMLHLEKEKREVIPLTWLQGMSNYYYIRFKENNITDIQNLAQSDLVFLRKNMSCGYRLIADFVSQALLIAQFPRIETINQLRLRGIRDIISFKDALEVAPEDSPIMTILGLSKTELLTIINSTAMQIRIDTLKEMKQRSDCKDELKFQEMG